MKKHIKLIFMTIMICAVGILTSCGGKNPEGGYVSLEEIESTYIENLPTDKTYTEYTVKGNFNFMGQEVQDFPNEVELTKEFTPAVDKYSDLSASHYLFAPLQITKENWVVLNSSGNPSKEFSVREKIISKMYKVNNAYNDTCYMYLEDDGGFTIKSFGVNKPITLYRLRISGMKQKKLVCKGKFDITLKYNAEGFLVEERFETLNAFKDSYTKTCYGYATYTYSV